MAGGYKQIRMKRGITIHDNISSSVNVEQQILKTQRRWGGYGCH